MRYYRIDITKAGASTPFKTYTSYPTVNGVAQNDPGALNVLLDAYVASFATPQAQTAIQIFGVSIDDLSQANNFTGCSINVYAGFQKGLPLNNPAQAGLILTGTINQSFGNWSGTEMVLSFVVVGAGSVASQDTNISFSWLPGVPLATALATTFTTAFPGLKQNIQVNPKLIIAHEEHGAYQSLPALAQFLKPLTAAAIGGSYQGVDIVVTPNGISVFDGTTQSTPIQIAFAELIGQPTWIQPLTLQIMCPMRSDLTVGSYIALPKGILGNSANPAGAPGAVTTTSASQPQARQASIFSGTFQVILVHHMGIFRQPDGQAWVTVINAVVQAPQTTNAPVETLAVAP